MKTHSLEWLQLSSPPSTSVIPFAKRINTTLYVAAKAISIPVLLLAIFIGLYETIMSPDLAVVLQATLTISGFVFLALAVDAEKASAAWLLTATGVALPVLANLSANGAHEYSLMAAILIVGWVSSAMIRR